MVRVSRVQELGDDAAAARSGPCSPDRDLSQAGIHHLRGKIACQSDRAAAELADLCASAGPLACEREESRIGREDVPPR
jgi:hypothetical protein